MGRKDNRRWLLTGGDESEIFLNVDCKFGMDGRITMHQMIPMILMIDHWKIYLAIDGGRDIIKS